MRFLTATVYVYLYAFVVVAVMLLIALPRAAQWGARQGQVTAYTESP